jgi:hypothetical protein
MNIYIKKEQNNSTLNPDTSRCPHPLNSSISPPSETPLYHTIFPNYYAFLAFFNTFCAEGKIVVFAVHRYRASGLFGTDDKSLHGLINLDRIKQAQQQEIRPTLWETFDEI